MPKIEQNEVRCINHPDQIMAAQPHIGVMHQQKREEIELPFSGGNFNFDVHICPICEYVEFYARKFNPSDDNNLSAVQVNSEW